MPLEYLDDIGCLSVGAWIDIMYDVGCYDDARGGGILWHVCCLIGDGWINKLLLRKL